MSRKSGKHIAWHTEPLDSLFHVQCLLDFQVMVIQIYNIIPLSKKKFKNVCLFPCPWGYDEADTYLQSSWKDVALEVTVFSVRVRM